MADAQVGNALGVAAVGEGILTAISADGVNTVTVASATSVPVGSIIDIINKNTGAVLASNRQVTNLTSAGVLTYDGADVAAVPGTHVVRFSPGAVAQHNVYTNLNGGSKPDHGFDAFNMGSIEYLKLTLQFGFSYSVDTLNKMTLNDMVYALRMLTTPKSVT